MLKQIRFDVLSLTVAVKLQIKSLFEWEKET